jgi:hypothetical protein
MYTITPRGRICDAQGTSAPQDDREESYRTYAAWLALGNGPTPIDEPDDPPDPVEEITSAQEWGQALVRAFEAAAVKGGINSDPAAALALDRYLREVSGALLSGRLHVAYAALAELLESDPKSRPAGADDAALLPVYHALAARLALTPKGL